MKIPWSDLGESGWGLGSETFREPVPLGAYHRVFQLVQQLPRFGGSQGDIGHHDRIVNLGDGSANKGLADLVSEANCLIVGKVKAVGGRDYKDDNIVRSPRI